MLYARCWLIFFVWTDDLYTYVPTNIHGLVVTDVVLYQTPYCDNTVVAAAVLA